ncbi:hypothetical protein ZEAMMB73_Zm00001d030351 [Zea mays]|uniref:Uncharacterized protein n=1 Tax=Zea mays TaxID=4577 RepID=A0A1D6KC51_MAIZE|nr:hypothetical protein ZEAMMB73_Zm00001d030351 [Zea mays]
MRGEERRAVGRDDRDATCGGAVQMHGCCVGERLPLDPPVSRGRFDRDTKSAREYRISSSLAQAHAPIIPVYTVAVKPSEPGAPNCTPNPYAFILTVNRRRRGCHDRAHGGVQIPLLLLPCDVKVLVNEITSVRPKRILHEVPMDIVRRLLDVLKSNVIDAKRLGFLCFGVQSYAMAIMTHHDNKQLDNRRMRGPRPPPSAHRLPRRRAWQLGEWVLRRCRRCLPHVIHLMMLLLH